MTTTSSSPPADRVEANLPWSGVTTGTLILRALRRYPDRTAFVADNGRLTYAAVTDLVGRVQRAIADRGFRRGDRIGVLGGNSAEAWLTGVAVQASGMAVSWLHPLGSLEDQLYQLADLDAAACMVDAGMPTRGAELAAACGDVAVLGLGPSDFGPDLLAEADAAGASTAADLAGVHDIAMITYTGGTTGRPKGVVRRHPAAAQMLALGTLADFEISLDARFLAVAPISHVAGSVVVPVLHRGGTVYLQNGFDPERFLAAVERERITMSLAVPTMIYALLDHPAMGRTDLDSLELLLYGASPMSPTRLAEGLERLGPVSRSSTVRPSATRSACCGGPSTPTRRSWERAGSRSAASTSPCSIRPAIPFHQVSRARSACAAPGRWRATGGCRS